MRWVMAGISKGHGADDLAISNMHSWHVACGAQRREEGWQSGRGCKLGIALEQRETQAWRERAEKAEARVKELQLDLLLKNPLIEELRRDIEDFKERAKDLKAQLAAAKPYDLKA